MMKAAYWEEYGKFVVKQVEEPAVGPNDVKIRVAYCGICENDVSFVNGTLPMFKPPMILGHEFCGTIVQVGSAVTRAKLGQRVAANMHMFCGACHYCHNGQENFCENKRVASGGFAEYVVVGETALEMIPDDMSFETAAFLEITSASMHSIDRLHMQSGKTVMIFGGGTKAQIDLMLSIRQGATLIALADPRKNRRELALENGADVVIDPFHEDLFEIAKRITQGRGFDYVIEATGEAERTPECIEVAAANATILWGGNYAIDAEAKVPLFTFRAEKELTITTSIQSPYTFARAMAILPKLNLAPLIESIYSIDDINVAFEKVAEGNAYRVLVKP